ncbi:uncharacterized protein LOC131685194 [Topomyia yanbarensis]|uniref:uncharacterized protein LOC131685194 n=1 Tax=Topomyia yanbarensis TaxID=2498891 RepID=UPI00273BC933|nr:uncharacterized protein LOC131685194 [Topomyia yanbarensis]
MSRGNNQLVQIQTIESDNTYPSSGESSLRTTSTFDVVSAHGSRQCSISSKCMKKTRDSHIDENIINWKSTAYGTISKEDLDVSDSVTVSAIENSHNSSRSKLRGKCQEFPIPSRENDATYRSSGVDVSRNVFPRINTIDDENVVILKSARETKTLSDAVILHSMPIDHGLSSDEEEADIDDEANEIEVGDCTLLKEFDLENMFEKYSNKTVLFEEDIGNIAII